MLSSENPLPPSDHEKKAKYLEVDLLNYSDGISQTHPNKFSIRYQDSLAVFVGKSATFLKNGVKNVLPPFETFESVRNPSPNVKWADENTSSSLSGLVSSKNAGPELASGDTSENFKSNSSELEEDGEYYFDVNPVPLQTKSPYPKPKKHGNTTRAAGKARRNIITENPGKKYRLIVKLGNNNISEPKPKALEFSEAMASSKVCPVCKTFTSSSNTTLNAHIDQCLSGESKVKRTDNPKKMMIKHRLIKPRKTRLMVDIYETALCCTLEDLDKRNGTSWASNLDSPVLDQEKNNNKNSSISSEDKKGEEEQGAVYIDSNGTKVRILSKLSDMNPKPNGEDDSGTRKLLERDKVSKKIPSKKKNDLVHREDVLKCPPDEQRHCSLGPDHCPEEVKFPPEENEKEDSAQYLKACPEHEHNKKKSNGSRLIIQWAGSKRTTCHQKKKKNHRKSHHPDNIITMKKSRMKSRHRLSLDDYKLIKRTRDLRLSTSSSDNINPYSPLSASENRKRKESMEQQLCQTNRAGYSLFDSQDFYDDKKKTNNHRILISKSTFKRIKENRTSFPNGKEFKKASPLSKNLMSIRPASFLELKKCLGSRNRFEFKKSSTIHMENNKVEPQMEKHPGNSSFDHRARVLKVRKKRWGFLNATSPTHSNASSESDSYGHATSPTHSNASSKSNSHGLEQNIGSLVGDSCIPGGMSGSINSVEISDVFLIAYEETLVHEQEMLCAGKDLVAQVNANEGKEDNYFVDVDPIPIPGPPGSFLPSPGRTCPEEPHGNSSLTSSKLHSSGDERELIDHMDSPISGVSFVSNSIGFRSHAVPRMVERSIPIGGDCKSPSLSAPNPVLRLMGKNLMVVNKDEVRCPQNEFPNARSRADDDAFTFSRGPSVHDNAFTLLGMTSGHQGFGPSLNFPGYAIRHDIEKAHTPPVTRLCTPDFLGDGRQGIVGIDDLSANTTGLGGFGTRHAAAGSMHVRSRCHDPMHASPYFSGCQKWCNDPVCSGSHMVHCYHAPPCNGSPATWNRTPEGTRLI